MVKLLKLYGMRERAIKRVRSIAQYKKRTRC